MALRWVVIARRRMRHFGSSTSRNELVNHLLLPLFDAYRQFYRKPSDPGLARRFLLERFQHNQSVVFLAMRRDGSAVGFTQLFPSFSSASAARILVLNDLFVLPETRRMRVGTRL